MQGAWILAHTNLRIVRKFIAIRETALLEPPEDIEEEAADMWERMQAIRACVNEIRELLGAAAGEEPVAQDLKQGRAKVYSHEMS